VRCLIVDDNAGFAAAARKVLEAGEITVVGTASSSSEAVVLFTELRPDVTLVDIDLGAESGIDLVEKLHQALASSPVILISAYSADDFHDPIVNSSAVGFVAKSELTASAIREVLGGLAGLQEGDHR
jgi:two-component system, NarL family, nitrate/nitrite response regulator NarL